jgi:hypothetical protein
MSAWSDSKHARHDIAKWAYATPAACPHLRTPSQALIAGASSMMDPFRTSMPVIYRLVAPAWADTIALRSDWGMYGMDQRYVFKAHQSDLAQGSLFDPDALER